MTPSLFEMALSIGENVILMIALASIVMREKSRFEKNMTKLIKWLKISSYLYLALMFINVFTAVINKTHGRTYIYNVLLAILWGVLAIMRDNEARKL